MKKQIKKELLKMLKSQMKGMMSDDMGESLGDSMSHKNDMPKKMSKVTVMGDSPEAVEKGLSKAQEIMKAKLGEASLESEKLKKKKSKK